MPSWIRRLGSKTRGFRYATESGAPVRDARTLARIDALRVPPAWRDVHLAASAGAAVQAWGFDAKGRKQYRYHAREVERGALRKYHRVRQMAHDLPVIRAAVARHLRALERGAATREAVAAAVVRLIADGFLRVGSERYAKENGTFGVATLRKKHVRREGDLVVFAFPGKQKIFQRKAITDRALARVVDRLAEAPGHRLFRWRGDDGRWNDLTARDVNAFLHDLVGVPYSAKDFRTWGGTLRAATVLAEIDPHGDGSPRERTRNVVTAMRLVAAELGNTPAICRASYVHPIVVARYLDEGETIARYLARPGAGARGARGAGARAAVRRRAGTGGRVARSVAARADAATAHAPEERALIAFLARHFPERRKKPRTGEDAA